MFCGGESPKVRRRLQEKSMKDAVIRSALRADLAIKYAHDPDTIIVEELGVGHGAARVDVAVINSLLEGYEIKSDYDTLNRLPEQIRLYGTVFDKVTLIVGYKHAYEALQMVPLWWGVTLVHFEAGAVCFSEAREAHPNPSPSLLAIVNLLWRSEALQILEQLDAVKGLRSKPRVHIYSKLVETVGADTLKTLVRQYIKARADWRVDQAQG